MNTNARDEHPHNHKDDFQQNSSEPLAIINGLVVLNQAASRTALESPSTLGDLLICKTSVLIKDGRIAAVGDSVHHGISNVFDASGLHVLPGVIDSQVHFREPGLTHKEDLESGTRGAVLGGVTTVFEMPNTKPSTTTVEAFAEKLALAKGRVWSDISFFIGATPDNASELARLERLPHCCAVKIFMGSSTGTLLVADDEPLTRILSQGRRRVAVHCEDEARLKERRHLVEGSGNPSLHPLWRDELTALNATQRLVRIARQAGRRVHVLHVTTGEEMAFLRDQKPLVTVETTPQHLTLSAPECYERLGTLAQMNPPIRDARHQEALWKAIENGTVDVIGSDHAPHTLQEKAHTYPDTPSGMTGVQTLLPLMLNHHNRGRISLERLVQICCLNPSRLYGATGKGEIKVGMDADLTIVDLKKERRIENSWIASRARWTPFDGMYVRGWPVATVVRGHWVMRDDQLIGSPVGKLVSFDHMGQ